LPLGVSKKRAVRNSRIFMTTLLDIQLARLLYPVLVDIAATGTPRTPQQLVHMAQARYPDERRIGHLIVQRIPRILAVISTFTERQKLPNLAVIIVNARAYPSCAAQAEQLRVNDCHWRAVSQDFNQYAATAERALGLPARRSREAATQLLSEYYAAHREDYGKAMRYLREVIIDNLANGMEVEQAFEVEARLLAPERRVVIEVKPD
jgi:hypothetical protein